MRNFDNVPSMLDANVSGGTTVVVAAGDYLFAERTLFVWFTVPENSSSGSWLWSRVASTTPTSHSYPGKLFAIDTNRWLPADQSAAVAYWADRKIIVAPRNCSGMALSPLRVDNACIVSGVAIFHLCCAGAINIDQACRCAYHKRRRRPIASSAPEAARTLRRVLRNQVGDVTIEMIIEAVYDAQSQIPSGFSYS